MLKIDKSEWTLTKLGEIAEEITVRVDNPSSSKYDRFVGLEHIVSGDLKIKSWSSTSNLTSSAKAFKAGDILFARRNAYLRRASLVEFEGCCSGDAFVLREIQQKIIPGFLPFIVNSNSLWDYANANAAGTMSKRVKWRDLASYEFQLPPKTFQSEISEILWRLHDSVEKEKNLLSNCELFRDLHRELLFTYGISALGSKVVKTKPANCGEIPSHWSERKFSEIVEITSGQVDPKKKEFRNLFQIGSERIESNTGIITEYKTAQELGITSGNYLFTKEHLIYSKIRPYLKKVANPEITGLCSADIYPLLPNKDLISKEFLFYYLLSEKFTRSLLQFQNRTGMPKVNREELGAMYIPIPAAKEQTKIVEVLSKIDDLRISILKKINCSEGLLKSLINHFFS